MKGGSPHGPAFAKRGEGCGSGHVCCALGARGRSTVQEKRNIAQHGTTGKREERRPKKGGGTTKAWDEKEGAA